MSRHANCRPQDRAGSPASALGLAFAANQSLPTPADVSLPPDAQHLLKAQTGVLAVLGIVKVKF